MVNWMITKYQHEWVDTRLRVLVWTDQPIHAFLHYSLEKELFAYITSERRGIRRLVKPLWELANPIILEQNVRGDTDCHVFLIPAIPDQATLTFFITATHDGIEAKSTSIPIRIQHPLQNSADPVNPLDLVDCGAFDPWTQNIKDAVGIHDDIWNITGMTGTGYFAYGMNQLSLLTGPTPDSHAQIYTGNIFDLGLDHTLHSQLRAIVRFPILEPYTYTYILHGEYPGDHPSYGFYTVWRSLYGYNANTLDFKYTFLRTIEVGDYYLLEAKHFPGEKIDFWINGDFIDRSTEYLPNAPSWGFNAWVWDLGVPSVRIHFRRFMIWKQSIWTS